MVVCDHAQVPLRGYLGGAASRKRYDRGVLHIIYSIHGNEADYRRIEPDLNLVAKENRPLVLVFEDVLTIEHFRAYLDPSLRDRHEILCEPRALNRNREAIAIAYADAVKEMNGRYQAWNALPAARKETAFGGATSFNHCLRTWAADRGVELVRAETSLETWLAYTDWMVHSVRTNEAVAQGDAATMWAENRKEWEACARSMRLRDAEVNAQIVRLLNVERRGHDVLYVVGVLHASNEDLLVRDLEAVVHERRAFALTERLMEELKRNTMEDREQLETLAFLDVRFQLIRQPTASTDDLTRLIDKIARAAAAHNVTLRGIIDYLITIPAVQQLARMCISEGVQTYVAWAIAFTMIDGGFIDRAEAETYLCLPVR